MPEGRSTRAISRGSRVRCRQSRGHVRGHPRTRRRQNTYQEKGASPGRDLVRIGIEIQLPGLGTSSRRVNSRLPCIRLGIESTRNAQFQRPSQVPLHLKVRIGGQAAKDSGTARRPRGSETVSIAHPKQKKVLSEFDCRALTLYNCS